MLGKISVTQQIAIVILKQIIIQMKQLIKVLLFKTCPGWPEIRTK